MCQGPQAGRDSYIVYLSSGLSILRCCQKLRAWTSTLTCLKEHFYSHESRAVVAAVVDAGRQARALAGFARVPAQAAHPISGLRWGYHPLRRSPASRTSPLSLLTPTSLPSSPPFRYHKRTTKRECSSSSSRRATPCSLPFAGFHSCSSSVKLYGFWLHSCCIFFSRLVHVSCMAVGRPPNGFSPLLSSDDVREAACRVPPSP